MDSAHLAYAAGFVDGEGSIMIVQDKRLSREKFYRLRVSVCNTDKTVLDWFSAIFGFDGVHTRSGGFQRQPQNKPVYTLLLGDKKAAEFVSLILPYLIIKRRHAELAIKFQALKDYQRNTFDKETKLFLEMKKINRRGNNV